MTATDELRRLLDERGVEWEENWRVGVKWTADGRRYVASETLCDDYGLLAVFGLTPEQAVEATLGRGECKLHDCEGSFSSTNRPVWRCDCGAFMTQYTDATTYHKPRYCPDCGRKVMA